MTHTELLTALKNAGLDSLPGRGAEILNDRVRRLLAKGKCSGRMAKRNAGSPSAKHHHLSYNDVWPYRNHLRRTHATSGMDTASAKVKKPANAKAILAFIPWPYQDEKPCLKKCEIFATKLLRWYIRMLAICRIMLPNIKNIQASWLTVGKPVAQLCLHAYANDFGSIMIEENVVSAAGPPIGLPQQASKHNKKKQVLSHGYAASNMNLEIYPKT